jgi:lipoprotein-anchoring transpeptidase ErfK/SrfK
LSNPTEVGAPLVFLVTEEMGEWVEVLLPIRPNGSRGWLRTADVELLEHRFRVQVDLGAHRITVTEGAKTILKAPVGIGTQDTPTPGGLFYIKELLRPPDPDTIYGPYAYGLSGFSNQLTSFAGGEGVIGIHGTNAPWTVGQNLSHGCIRMLNHDIEKLVPLLPLGTPVKIVR